LKIWEMTDIGLVRKDNQDSYGVLKDAPGGYTVLVVCDGMGGAAAGQVASSIAVETFLREMEAGLSDAITAEQLQALSAQAVAAANQAIHAYADEHPECQGMGTTLVSAAVRGENAVLCNVGDSRAYRVTADDITRITKDHSLVESMVDRGDITAEEARRHPKRNLITRALGPDDDATCDVYITTLTDGQFLLLCTDGLVDTVSDQEILFEIIHGDSVDTCLQRLLAIAKANGAPDNVTAVLMQAEKGGA